MSKYNRLAKLVKLSKQNDIANKFVEDLLYTIEQENLNDYIPTQSYKPSGVGDCKRALYYQMTGTRPDMQSSNSALVGICESGTERHEDIQSYIMLMRKHNIDCDWCKVSEFVMKNKVKDLTVLKESGFETKLFSSKYNMRFMCDGLIKYDNEYYIVEIKTESNYKFNHHDEPYLHHKIQACCYCMCLGLTKVIFIYENRDNCTKKGFLFEPNKEMMKDIEDTIQYVDDCVKFNVLPRQELTKCSYCKYKEQCMRDGE